MGFKIVLPNDRAYFSKLRAGRSLRRNLSIATASLVVSLLILLLEYPVWSRFRGTSPLITQRRTAIVSNLQNDLYVANALILGYTIQKHNPNITREGTDLILLVPKKNDITYNNMMRLQKLWSIRYEDDIEVKGSERLLVHHRRNYIKLRIWSWVTYTKIAWIDADCMVMGDISLLLSDKFDFGAVQDTFPWKMPAENFNAGVLSIKPSLGKFDFLINATKIFPVEDGAEQTLLNHLFPLPSPSALESFSYIRTELPPEYNLNLEAYRSHRARWNELWKIAKVVHFTSKKPRVDESKPGDWGQAMDVWYEVWDEFTGLEANTSAHRV